MSPVLFGCKVSCEKVRSVESGIKQDIERIDTLIKNAHLAKVDRRGEWERSCAELPRLSTRLNMHRDTLFNFFDDIRKKEDAGRISDGIAQVRANVAKLQLEIGVMCDMVRHNAQPDDWSDGNGRTLNGAADRTINYIRDEIIQKATAIEDEACIDVKSSSLSPPGSDPDPRVCGGQKGSVAEPALESSEAEPAQPSVAGSARG